MMTAPVLRLARQAQNPVARRAVRQARRIQAWRRLAGPLVPLLVGETGVPWADPAGQGRWDDAMDAYLAEHMADPTTTVCLWEVGPGVGSDGKLGLMTDIDVTEGGSGTKGITHERRNLTVPQRWWRHYPDRVGANYAGGEYMGNGGNISAGGVFSNLNTGALGTDYFLPRASGTMSNDAPFLAARGLRVVRLPIRWERMVSSPGGALQATPVAELHAAIAQFMSAGFRRIILDCHNYAQFWLGTSPTARSRVSLATSSGSPTAAHLADFWVRMDAEFTDDELEFDLMNESSNAAAPGIRAEDIVEDVVASFDAGTSSWTLSGTGTVSRETSSPVFAGGGALKITRTWGAGFTQITAREPSGPYSRDGALIRFRVWVPSSGISSGVWQCRIEANGTVDTTQIKNLTSDAWTTVDFNPPAGFSLASHSRIGINIFANNGNGSTTSVYVDSVETVTPKTPPKVYEGVATLVADALASAGSTRRLWLTAYGTSESGLTTNHHAAGPWYAGSHPNYGYSVHNYHDRNEAGSDSTWEFGVHSRAALAAGW